MVLDIEGDRLDARFLNDAGTLLDRYTIVKNTATPPTADFSGSPRTGSAPLSVAFEDLSSTNTAEWAWDFDADSIIDSSQRDPTPEFSVPGDYSVRLTAVNDAGQADANKVAYSCAYPGPSRDLVMRDTETIEWDAVPGATSYDVIRGSVSTLLADGGDFGGSSLGCAAAGTIFTQATDAHAPGAGTGAWYYLVRAVACAAEMGTYDSDSPNQVAGRDATIDPSSCP